MNLPKEICLEYLNYYEQERRTLLESPKDFKKKYPEQWQDNLRVQDILQNIDNHINFWKVQNSNNPTKPAQPNNKIPKNKISPLKPTAQLPKINPNIICKKCNLPMRLRKNISGTAYYCDNYAYCGGMQQ